MMIPAYSFDILNENDLIATVKVSNDVVSVEKYCNKIGIQPFYGGDITRNRIEDFLKSRCFDRNRSDCSELLLNLGLKEYNPLAIIRKTHGRLFNDLLWIRFSNESITWKDVKHG